MLDDATKSTARVGAAAHDFEPVACDPRIVDMSSLVRTDKACRIWRQRAPLLSNWASDAHLNDESSNGARSAVIIRFAGSLVSLYGANIM